MHRNSALVGKSRRPFAVTEKWAEQNEKWAEQNRAKWEGTKPKWAEQNRKWEESKAERSQVGRTNRAKQAPLVRGRGTKE